MTVYQIIMSYALILFIIGIMTKSFWSYISSFMVVALAHLTPVSGSLISLVSSMSDNSVLTMITLGFTLATILLVVHNKMATLYTTIIVPCLSVFAFMIFPDINAVLTQPFVVGVWFVEMSNIDYILVAISLAWTFLSWNHKQDVYYPLIAMVNVALLSNVV